VQIPSVLDSHLRVDGNFLGHDLASDIFDELTMINPAWIDAKKRKVWDMSDIEKWIILGELDGDTVIAPRGYAMEYKLLLRKHGHRVQWVDRRTWRSGPPFGYDRFSYLDHQRPAVAAMIKHEQGIYEAPTGSGKTVCGCGLMWERHPEFSLILVDRLELMDQWKKRLVQHTGISPDMIGQIGGGKWEEKRITVATVQTLRKALREGSKSLGERFFKKWSIVILDECHHVTSDTLQELIQLFWARYRIGFSATPDRQDMLFDVALDVLGDVFYADSEDELRAAGIITTPRVHRIQTNFDYIYWGDHQSDRKGNCQVPWCKKTSQHGHRNNYQKLKDALVMDKARNGLVVSCLMSQIMTGPHIHLVVSDEVRQLEALIASYEHRTKNVKGDLPPVYLLTGRQTKKQRREIVEALEHAENAVLFSTVAKEGLDIPAIDRIYLPFPNKQPANTEQKIGRGTRAMVGKGQTLIFDFCDTNIIVLRRQFKNRRFRVYDRLGLEVVM
jgi:superfamily II DNA or RNA helicase